MRILTALPSPARSELLGYENLLYEVYEAARPSKRVRVLELTPYRAVVAAGIHLGISADKLRCHRVPNDSIDGTDEGLVSLRLT